MGGFVSRSEQLRGARLGGYEIVGLIGHGATASVFEATHVALGKRVAVKILHEHLASDEQIRSRFIREGRIAARLRHPHTVEVLDVGLESDVPYLVMELLSGGDLRALLADVHVLTIEHALAFLLPIASALAHAHDVGVLHRDLKPANIFLSRDLRGDVVPKLVDFGLSKVATSETTSALTATELVAGTVLYMAPEQTLGVRHSSPASDQYSLAVILYECLTGTAPFLADSVYALLERIRADIARPPSLLNPRIPEDLDSVILRGLQHDPAKRFSSVRALGRALLPFADAATSRTLERDFVERTSATTAAASASQSRPSIRKVAAEAETRAEVPAASSPPNPTPIRERVAESPLSASAIRAVAPLPCAPGTGPFHIKGISYRSFALAASKAVPGGLDAFCDALADRRLRGFIRQPFLASGRYDIFPFLPLYATLARVLEVPFDRLVRDTASAQAQYDAQTVFKAIWAKATLDDIADRLTRFGNQWYDFGKISGATPGPNEFLIVHEGFPSYIQPWFKPMHMGYTEGALQIAGALDVKLVSHESVIEGSKDGYALVTLRSHYRWRTQR